MKKIFYGFLALAGLAMVSCSQEIDEQINANTDSVKKIFTANTEDGASTRTSIALEEQTGNYVVIWSGDEKIAVNGVDYKVIDGAGTKSVTFGADVEGTEAATAEVYNAVYPNNAWVEGGLNLEHLKAQTALNATYGHGYAVTVATTTDKEMDFKFKNALSFLRVRFSLAADAKEDAITIKTVKITANDNLWGTVSEVNYATGEIGAVANDSELGKSIVYTAGEDVVLDRAENAIFDAVIAVPVNEEGRTLTIEITGENAWTGTPYTYKAEGVTKKYLRNNVTTLAKAIKPVEVLLVADGVYKTAEDTFQIFNANGMKWLADAVNSGNSFANKTVQLIDNIDLSVFDNWTPIGFNENGIVESTDKYFTGTFDGQGYTIYNLNIENDNAGGVGLFGAVHDATFKNFTLEDVNIKAVDADATSDISGAQGQANYIVGGHIGAVAAYDAKAGTVTFDNVHLKGLIKIEGETRYAQGQRIAGVFGGKSSSKVVFNKVSVMGEDGSYIKGYCSTAGVVGQHMGVGTFTDVHTDIDVYGVTFGVGGIAGITLKDSTFDNCSSAGDLTLDARAVQPASYSGNYFFRIGGIAGCWSESANAKLTLTNCSYTGTFKSFNKEGNSPFAFDYDGYVGRGFTLNGCAGSTVIIDGKEFVQVTDNIHGFYMVDGVYEISSEAGLKWLAAQVKEGNTFDGKTVKLTQNIALTEPWTPIGNSTDGVSKSFRGNFDGQNYTISDMVVNAGDAAAGFFGSKWDGDIKDVNFDNATITGSHYGGVVVGWADGANYNYNWTISGCEITNSTVTLAVENNDNGDKAGAVVGYAYAITVTENVVSNTTIQAYRDFGGIVGMAQENTTTDPHSEYAVVSNNTIGENVKLIVDNTTNYQNYEIRSKYNVGQYVGRVSCHSVVDGNTGEATIEWGDIPAKLPTAVDKLNEQIASGAELITLTEDIVAEEGEIITIASGKSVTIDLNGKTISQDMECTASYVLVNNNGTLVIEDSSAAKTGTIIVTDNGAGDSSYGWGTYTVRNSGTLTINGGTIKNVKKAEVSHCAVPLMLYSGKTTINEGANIISANYRTIQGFYNPEVIINGGNFEGQVWMHSTCSADASLTINGGTFAPRGNDGSSVFLNNTNDIKLAITGGYFTTKVGCDYDTKSGVQGAITGGTFTEAAYTGGKTKQLIAEGYAAIANGDGTYTVEEVACDIDGIGYLTLQAAIAAAKDGDTINIYEGTHTLPEGLGNNIALTLKGAGKDKTIVNGTKNASNNNQLPGNYATGMTLVLEDLNFTTANEGYYGGFGHAQSVTFRNSKIVGQFYCHSNAPHYFYDCTIDPLNGYLYTYASDVEIEGCHFAASQGKALQVYAEGAGTFNVNITDCTFVAAKQATTWDGEPVTAIDINSANGAKFVVNIDGCNATGFPTGLNSGSSLWNNKKALGEWLTLTVDGVLIEDITGGFGASADGEVVVW